MARVTVEDCLEKVPNRFALTVLASRRARALSESRGTPLVQCSNKAAVTALREIAAAGVRYVEDVDEAMRGYIDEQRAQLRGSSGMDHTFIDAVSFGPIGTDDDEGDTDDVKELTADLASLGTGGEEEESDEKSSETPEGVTPEADGVVDSDDSEGADETVGDLDADLPDDDENADA
jgi:DNA-directed RNA polymerase subunit omega